MSRSPVRVAVRGKRVPRSPRSSQAAEALLQPVQIQPNPLPSKGSRSRMAKVKRPANRKPIRSDWDLPWFRKSSMSSSPFQSPHFA
jgi:hypothetical protein